MSPLLAILVLARQTGMITVWTPGVPFEQVCDRLDKQAGLRRKQVRNVAL